MRQQLHRPGDRKPDDHLDLKSDTAEAWPVVPVEAMAAPASPRLRGTSRVPEGTTRLTRHPRIREAP